MRWCCVAAVVMAGMAPAARGEEPQQAAAVEGGVFDQPGMFVAEQGLMREITALFAARDFAAAETRLRQRIAQHPADFSAHYNLACALARQGNKDAAIETLAHAVELGFRNRRQIETDEDLVALRDDPRFRAAATAADRPPQANAVSGAAVANEPADGEVKVDESNTLWNPRGGLFHVLFRLDKAGLDKDGADLPIAVGLGPAGDLLRQWHEEGTAAGNLGDLYDNRDRDHSNMTFAAFPQITRVEYSPAAKRRGVDYGAQTGIVFHRAQSEPGDGAANPDDGPGQAAESRRLLTAAGGSFSQATTIGNSSTAWVGNPRWRSQYRGLLTRPGGATLMALHYANNHLYFYPEHRDHDPGHNGKGGQGGHGDVTPANTPYVILSQGSSGSDIAFMNAVAATLAAFRPEVKRELAARGMLMPAVQMIFRMSNKKVAKPEDYLTGAAHPTAFDAGSLDVEKMVRMAHGIEATSLPPICHLRVVEEDESVIGRDYFDVLPRERLIDTACAIARVVKSSKYERRFVISAEQSLDRHGKPLTFHWVVLRGDEGLISITPLNDAMSVVELKVAYHGRRPILPGSPMESNRVDIGAFVRNGEYFSAPAFVSLSYLDNERREYDEQHRIRVIDYAADDVKGNYVDPMLDLPKDWRDEYRYGDDGRLRGWTRIRGERREEFTPEGRLVIAVDEAGEPTATVAVRYVAKAEGDAVPSLQQEVVEESAAPDDGRP